MIKYQNKFSIVILFFLSFVSSQSLADNNDIQEILEIIQKDLKTLEKAVYSNSSQDSLNTQSINMDSNSEEVLTRHLLKLSEIENQFKELTNKFEEINFKLDKLSNRLSKVQADNQIRFQELENNNFEGSGETKTSSVVKKTDEKILPGSSEHKT